MLDKLRAKPGADRLSLICGDLADVPAEGRFDLIYIVYNTLTCLVTQSDQLRCFQNVGQKLTEHGAFVVETFVPWKTLLEGRINEVGAVTEDSVNFILGRVDPVQQVMDTQLVVIDKRGTKLFPVRYRYVWPSELDLMAHNAGLKLEERWGTWDRHPFTAESKSQIAIYRPK
jgi:hypothetical protein